MHLMSGPQQQRGELTQLTSSAITLQGLGKSKKWPPEGWGQLLPSCVSSGAGGEGDAASDGAPATEGSREDLL